MSLGQGVFLLVACLVVYVCLRGPIRRTWNGE